MKLALLFGAVFVVTAFAAVFQIVPIAVPFAVWAPYFAIIVYLHLRRGSQEPDDS